MGLSDLRYKRPTREERGPGRWSVRKAAVSVFIAVTVLSMVVVNMPESEIEDLLDRPVYIYTSLTGLHQNWGVFAPNPRSISLDMYATVEFADGSTARWDMPEWGPFVGSYRHYRWRKWMTNVRKDANEDELWEPTARWVAGRFADRGQVAEVSLVRRFRDVPKPGHVPPLWDEYLFYTLDLDG